jgi:hypothetical protein
MVDVGVKTDLFTHGSTLIGEVDQDIRPGIALTNATRSHSKTFGSQSNSLDVFHSKQPGEHKYLLGV